MVLSTAFAAAGLFPLALSRSRADRLPRWMREALTVGVCGVLLLLVAALVASDGPSWTHHRNNPQAEENCARLLEGWRRAGHPIFHAQHLSDEPGSPLRAGQPGAEFKDIVRPLGDEKVVQKRVNSAFIGTDLEICLRRRGITTLVLVGLTTDHCVSTTARMAGNLGFDTYLVGDAAATFDRVGPDGRRHDADEVHELALASLHSEFATVVDTEAVLGLLPESRRVREDRGEQVRSPGS